MAILVNSIIILLITISVSLQESVNTKSVYMESASADDDDDNIDREFDYFNSDVGIILENEEEYDILNNETFGDGITGLHY